MKKILVLIYGALAYIISVVVILYAIGFIGNLFVPRTIDSVAESSPLKALLINVILITVFAIQHSVMARPSFKKWFTAIVNPAIERSTYILLSSLALILVFYKWEPITSIVWKIENEFVTFILVGLYFIGWIIVLFSTFMINHLELFGLAQVYDNFKNKQTPNPTFQIKYLYKLVRHPLMLGFLITFWSTPIMTLGHLLFTVLITFYVFIAVKYLEEKDLRKDIGEKYGRYQKEVPMFIPFTKIK